MDFVNDCPVIPICGYHLECRVLLRDRITFTDIRRYYPFAWQAQQIVKFRGTYQQDPSLYSTISKVYRKVGTPHFMM